MALQLLPLLFGGFAAKTAIDRGLASHDRGVLAEGLQSAFGQQAQIPGQAMGQPRDAGNAATYGIPQQAIAAPTVSTSNPNAAAQQFAQQQQLAPSVAGMPGQQAQNFAPNMSTPQALGQVQPGAQVNQDGSIGAPPQQAGLFPNSGINDPTQMLQQAAGLFALPGGDVIGQDIISSAFEFAQRNQEQQRRFGQQDIEQERSFGQRDEELIAGNEFTEAQNALTAAARKDEFDQTLSEQERANRARENLNLFKEGAIMNANGEVSLSPEAAAAAAATGEQGTIPTGFERHLDQNGQPYLKAQPGSIPYTEAVQELATTESAIRAIDEQIQSIKKSGTELTGQESARQNARYGAIISSIAELRGLGVIQKDEAERLEDTIPNPSNLSGLVRNNKTTIAAYEELMSEFQRKGKVANQKYSHWGLGSNLAEATPEQIRELNERARQEALAAQLGLTIDKTPKAAPIENTFSSTPSAAEIQGLGGLWEATPLDGSAGGLDIEAINRAGRQ